MVDVPVEYKVPGGPFAVAGRGEWLRATALNALVFGPGLLSVNIASRINRRAGRRLECWLARQVVRGLSIELEVEGAEHLATDERFVVAPLHEGFADVLALLTLGSPMRFVALDEIAESWPILRRHIKATDHVLVPAGKPRVAFRRMMRAIDAVSEAGDHFVVFPQGTILGIETAFQPGFGRIAERLDRRILPVVLTGSHRVWEHPFSSRLRFGQRISMHVLSPIAADELDVQALERRMKNLALGPEVAPARRYEPERDGSWPGYSFAIDPEYDDVVAP